MDDVRVYRREFLDAATVRQEILQRPPTSAELDDMILWLHFDDDDDIQSQAGVSVDVSLGGGQVQRSPLLVPSTAPLFQSSTTGKVFVDAIQDPTTNATRNVNVDLIVAAPGEATVAPTLTSVVVHSVVSAIADAGRVVINDVEVGSGTILAPSPQVALLFEQVVGKIGAALVTINATFTTTGADQPPFLQTVQIVVSVRDNVSPRVGSAGNAAAFDGINDFYIADALAWPTKEVIVDGRSTRGLSAITIEFWAYIDEDSAGDTALIALGGNTEQNQSWVDQFNRRRRSGRWHITLPSGSGQLVWRVGDAAHELSARPFYNGWAHYAFVHDGVEGTAFSVVVNGRVVMDGRHDHDGLQSGQLDLNHVTIGTWTFWSEVYHKGVVDDFRLWNRSRTVDEIRSTMDHQLSGGEDRRDLFAYWTFDQDVDGVVVDATGRGNDLRGGGCVSCEPRFYCQPHSVAPVDVGPGDCLPSAKSVESAHFRLHTCYGGPVCFKGEERVDTRPTIVASDAPIGGYVFHPVAPQGAAPIRFRLNGTDLDDDDLTFTIRRLPDRRLDYLSDDDSWIAITSVPLALPAGVDQLRLHRTGVDGGRPLAQVEYAADDGMATSPFITLDVSVTCRAGRFLNPSQRRCDACPSGTFSDRSDFATSCRPCPINQFQAKTGQASCQPCLAGVAYTTTTGSASCRTCNATMTVSSDDEIAPSSSLCAINLRFDTSVVIAGAGRSIIDFSSLLPAALPVDDARATILTLPVKGTLHQIDDDGALGDNFMDYFFAEVDIVKQFVDEVVDASTSLVDRPRNATMGLPNAEPGRSSPLAWAAYDGDNGVGDITLHFPEALFMTGVVLFENIGGGAITKIEARSTDDDWMTVWSGAPLEVGLAVGRRFQPNVCPTNVVVDTLRLTMNSLKCSGRNELDAVMMLGARQLRNSRRLLVKDRQLRAAYVLPSADKAILQVGEVYSDKISYELRNCGDGDFVFEGVQQLNIALGHEQDLELHASAGFIVFAILIGSIGLALIGASIVLIYINREAPVILGSSVFFMNLQSVGIALGWIVLILSAVMHSNPDSIANGCMWTPLLFSIAFHLVVGSILVKTARVVLIFEHSAGNVVKLTSTRLALFVVMIVAIDVGILMAAGFTHPLHVTVVHIGTWHYRRCMSIHAHALAFVSNAFKLIMLVASVSLAIKSRNVPSTFNEVKAMALTTYSIATNAFIYIVIGDLVAGPNPSMMVTTITLSMGLITSWVTLIASKLYIALYRPDMNILETVRVTTKVAPAGSSTPTNRTPKPPFQQI